MALSVNECLLRLRGYKKEKALLEEKHKDNPLRHICYSGPWLEIDGVRYEIDRTCHQLVDAIGDEK